MKGRLTLSDSLLRVEMLHRVGTVSLDVSFTLKQPWTVLFGPSGSGKTTVLRTVAGFVRPDMGRILYGPLERELVDTNEHLFVSAYLRPVRYAAQTARLFRHRSVRENVAYGMEWPSHPEDQQEVLDEVLGLMRLTTLGDRGTEELSGGERQRVSVARAVASAVTYDGIDKALLLLDEPFAGLDSMLRDELAVALRDRLAHWKVAVLSVSHDIGECYLLGAEVLRMAEGQIMEQGPVDEVLDEERRRLLKQLRTQ